MEHLVDRLMWAGIIMLVGVSVWVIIKKVFPQVATTISNKLTDIVKQITTGAIDPHELIKQQLVFVKALLLY